MGTQYLHEILDKKLATNDSVVMLGLSREQVNDLREIAKQESLPLPGLLDKMINNAVDFKKREYKRNHN